MKWLTRRRRSRRHSSTRNSLRSISRESSSPPSRRNQRTRPAASIAVPVGTVTIEPTPKGAIRWALLTGPLDIWFVEEVVGGDLRAALSVYLAEIGRGSGRERGEISVVAGA